MRLSAYFEKYVENFNLPVYYGVQVNLIDQNVETKKYMVRSGDDNWEAKNVVIATGLFQQPKIPSFSSQLPSTITQIPSGKYRNPQQLPSGAVLVVGSAQSGCQIAEELYKAGRKVYLSTGRSGRVPRRYRGRDIFEWFDLTGFWDRTADHLPSPEAKFTGSLQVSGGSGGHNLNLHQFSHDGVVLLGRLKGAGDNTIFMERNLKENLAQIDKFEAEIIQMIDFYISENGLDAPLEELPQLRNGYDQEVIPEINLQDEGITTCIWAMGYKFDFNLVELPVLDRDGYPIQERGVTGYPGLFFVGLPWLYKLKSGLLFGVGEDAEYIASRIDSRRSI